MTNPATSSDDADSYDNGYDFTESRPLDGGVYGYNYVYGSNITDVLGISGVTVSLTMGLVNETSAYSSTTGPKGVLGIGYNDSIGSSDNLPLRLLEQGLTNTTAYSIWMDDDIASSGNLLFGAIDTTKFTGNLTRLSSSYSAYEMVIRAVSINGTTKNGGPFPITSGSDDDTTYGYSTGSSGSDDYLFTAIYSPPDTVSILPSYIAAQIWDMAGAYYDEDIEQALIGCSAANSNSANFTIQLGGQAGPILAVSMADLVVPSSEYNISESYSYLDLGDDVCLFGVQNTSSSSYGSETTLGNTLLRRTYSVFDLANSEVAVAPVVFGASATSNIVPFESYGATVPSSTLICSYSYCGTSAGGNSNDSEGVSENGLPNILSLGALLGLSLGLALGCLALGFLIFFFCRHRRNKKLVAKGAASVSSAEAGETTMSRANAGVASVPGTTRQTAQESRAEHTAGTASVDKGKGPEVASPLPSRHKESQAVTPGEAEASTGGSSVERGQRAL